MTVKQLTNNTSQERGDSGSGLRISKVFSSPELSMNAAPKFDGKKVSGGETDRILFGKAKLCAELETDQESAGSSEEIESPRSVSKVGKWTPKNIAYVHSQILRIREEDSHLGEDIGEGCSAKDKLAGHHVASHVDVMLFPRPASPLGGNTAINTVH